MHENSVLIIIILCANLIVQCTESSELTHAFTKAKGKVVSADSNIDTLFYIDRDNNSSFNNFYGRVSCFMHDRNTHLTTCIT